MGKFKAVFKREYLERVRTKSFILVTLLGPLLMGAFIIVPAIMSARSMKNARLGSVQFIDASGNGLGDLVVKALGEKAEPESLSVKVVGPSELAQTESLATIDVQKARFTGFVVLDSETVAGRTARYAGKNASSLGEMETLENSIRQTVLTQRLLSEGLDPARIAALTGARVQMTRERISKDGRGGSGMASTVLGFAIAFLLYMSLILYGQNTLRSVLEEKTTRVAEVIVASVKTDTLLAGKVLAVSAVGLTQQLVWVVSAYGIYTARGAIFVKLGLPASTPIALPHVTFGMGVAFLLFFVLGFIFYSSLFAAAGATVSSDQEAQQAATPVMMLLVASIVFLNPILVAPSSTLAKVLSWLPFSAPIVMPLRMSLSPLSGLEISLVLLGLAAAGGVAIWISSRIYRVGMLMYGKKPSMRELVRWVRQA